MRPWDSQVGLLQYFCSSPPAPGAEAATGVATRAVARADVFTSVFTDVLTDAFTDVFTEAGGGEKNTAVNQPANPRSHANFRKCCLLASGT